jgi:hypothetical protein
MASPIVLNLESFVHNMGLIGNAIKLTRLW